MEFYSHAQKNEDGSTSPTKKLKHHLGGVVETIASNLHPHVCFPDFDIPLDLPNLLGLFHDMGKHTTYFQDYLLRGKFRNALKKSHSLVSAVFAFNFIKAFADPPDKRLGFMLYHCIRHHHGFVSNPLKLPDKSRQLSMERNLRVQTKNLLENAGTEIERLVKTHFPDLGRFRVTEQTFEHNDKMIRKIATRLERKSPRADHYFLMIYFFSLLIASDKIDAGDARQFSPCPICPDLVDRHLSRKKSLLLSGIRTRAKHDIEKKLGEIDIVTDRLFTITAPTGIGKTLSVMNFALRLKARIASAQNYQPQIIYCLPFINIIEQTHKVFHQLFQDEDVTVLKHHQYADIWAMAEKGNSDDKEGQLSKTLLEVEDWQADVVLTTFVQFFHSVISNRNRMLKKFHRIPGSIIILDEVQNTKAEYWPLIGILLHHLSEFMNCRIVLMTATQPLIFETAAAVFDQNQIRFKPLINSEEMRFFFGQFERTAIVSLTDKENPLEHADDFHSLFCEKWDPSKSCLIVVNTIRRSLDIFEKLSQEKICPDIYYLSTNIVPVHRKYVIRRVRKQLEEGKKVVLVSTQSVEAGVDLDFDMGFRDVGPLDSIIQVAGRINRNNRAGFRRSPLYIVNFKEDAQRIYGRITIRTTLEVLDAGKGCFSEDEYLGLIRRYYEMITSVDRKSFEPARELYEAMRTLRFTRKDENDERLAVEDFRLIDDAQKGRYADVFVEMTKHAEKVLGIYEDEYMLCDDMNKQREIFLKIKSSFSSYKVSIPLGIARHLHDNSGGIRELRRDQLYVVDRDHVGRDDHEDAQILYDLSTGICRKEIESETLIF